jgi:hypothetical protein
VVSSIAATASEYVKKKIGAAPVGPSHALLASILARA